MDFTIPAKYYDEFEDARKIVQPGFRIDVFYDGAVFVTMLPQDYLKRSKPIRTKLEKIDLRALHPVDIILTKVGRLDKRDWQDIESCITKFKITRKQIEKRAKEMGYAGNDKVFRSNLQAVLGKFFN